MDSMNFLNKKYTTVHATSQLSHSRSRSSRTFLPSHLLTQPQPLSAHREPISQLPPPSAPLQSASMASSHCALHPQQLIRHLCLDCIELLCSQCIGEHIAVHKENNTFPNIQTLKQLRAEMNVKLEQILHYMFKEAHHPKNITAAIDSIRRESSHKIDALAKQLHAQLDTWIVTLKASVLDTAAHEETRLLQQEMYALHQEVNQLVNSLSSPSASVQDIKKAYQIDADRLQKCYTAMVERYEALREGMRVEVAVEDNALAQLLEGIVRIKLGGGTQPPKIDAEQSMMSPTKQFNLPLRVHDFNEQPSHQKNDSTSDVPLLFSLISGTDTLRVVDPLSSTQGELLTYQLQGIISFPLNSACLLPDGMLVVSGGIMAENQKSSGIQIYDYIEGRLVSQANLTQGRSSHCTVAHGDEIYFVGGFSSDNEENRDVEILRVDGITVANHKCKWGGPSLCAKLNNKIIKINISGIEEMDLATHRWQQWQLEVPFTLSKGMQVALVSQAQNPALLVFGDDDSQYLIDPVGRRLQKVKSSVGRPVLSAATVAGRAYAWVQDSQIRVLAWEGLQKGWVSLY